MLGRGAGQVRGMARRRTGQPVAACVGCGGRVGSVGPTALVEAGSCELQRPFALLCLSSVLHDASWLCAPAPELGCLAT